MSNSVEVARLRSAADAAQIANEVIVRTNSRGEGFSNEEVSILWSTVKKSGMESLHRQHSDLVEKAADLISEMYARDRAEGRGDRYLLVSPDDGHGYFLQIPIAVALDVYRPRGNTRRDIIVAAIAVALSLVIVFVLMALTKR